jgi:hypothetical protein
VLGLDAGSNPGGWGEVWTFTIDPLRLAAPVLSTPKDHGTIKDRTPTFTWNAVTRAVNYQIQVSDDYNFGGTLAADQQRISLNYTLPAANKLDYGVSTGTCGRRMRTGIGAIGAPPTRSRSPSCMCPKMPST